jgi:co-chaperonin GroES (HSP10)
VHKKSPIKVLLSPLALAALTQMARADMPIADGDTVVYGKYSGQEITLNGEDFKILRAADLLAKIDA